MVGGFWWTLMVKRTFMVNGEMVDVENEVDLLFLIRMSEDGVGG